MWTKLDDNFPDHEKVMRAGPLAAWLYVCGLCYSNRLLTDGFIPLGQVRKLADVDQPIQLADTLCEVGLWEHVENGYKVHDFHDFNLTADEAKERRDRISQERSEAGRKGAMAKWQNHSKEDGNLPDPLPDGKDGKTDGKSYGKTMAPPPVPTSHIPIPDPEPQESTRATAKRPRKPLRPLPDDFTVTDDMQDWATEQGLTLKVNIARETQKFVRYWTTGNGAGERKRDWQETWENWIERAAKDVRGNGGSNGTATKTRFEATEDYFAAIFQPANGAGAGVTAPDRPRLRGGPPETA